MAAILHSSGWRKRCKQGGLCAKRSARLTAEQAELLLEGRIDFLLGSGDPLLIELYSKMKGEMLRPRTIVTYEREAFIYSPGNVRVTLDRNLRTGLRSTEFLDLENRTVTAAQDTILEVKYDAFLPDIVRMAVQTPDRRTGAYSKIDIRIEAVKAPVRTHRLRKIHDNRKVEIL